MNVTGSVTSLPIIALLTDFGGTDGYTGVLKGIILSRTQHVHIVDISHDIAPHDVWAGSWVLGNSYHHFPPATIFVTVVDPGVGSVEQKPILLHWPQRQQFFIGPDNGLLTAVIREAGAGLKAYEIANADLWPTLSPSSTFHGRDIYSPTAAHLAMALSNNQLDGFINEIGPNIPQPVTLDGQEPRQDENTLHGQVMHVDTYGNVITNIPASWLPPENAPLVVESGKQQYEAVLAACYKQGKESDRLMVIAGSSGTIEIAQFGKVRPKPLPAGPEAPSV